MKALTIPTITLITELTINESIYYSILTSQTFQSDEQALKLINSVLSPFMHRVTLNNLRNSLREKGFISPPPFLRPLVNHSSLPSPPIQSINVLR